GQGTGPQRGRPAIATRAVDQEEQAGADGSRGFGRGQHERRAGVGRGQGEGQEQRPAQGAEPGPQGHEPGPRPRGAEGERGLAVAGMGPYQGGSLRGQARQPDQGDGPDQEEARRPDRVQTLGEPAYPAARLGPGPGPQDVPEQDESTRHEQDADAPDQGRQPGQQPHGRLPPDRPTVRPAGGSQAPGRQP